MSDPLLQMIAVTTLNLHSHFFNLLFCLSHSISLRLYLIVSSIHCLILPRLHYFICC